MNIVYTTRARRSFMVGLAAGLMMFMSACTTWMKPAGINEALIHERATTREENSIKVSAAIVSDEEAKQIFGLDLATKKIQAIWLEIENNSDHRLILLPTAIDDDYFAPLEVAFAFHNLYADKSYMALDEHLLEMTFPVRRRIEPMSRVSGYIFTNWSKGTIPIDLDLMGDHFSQNFSLLVPGPGSEQNPITVERLNSIYSDSEQHDVENDTILRNDLEQLPSCVSTEPGELLAEPLNIVIIGTYDDWATALRRRGYHHQKLNPRHVFGRIQDLAGEKLSLGYEKAQDQTLRIWRTPIRYNGKPVWVGQTSTRLGGRFADKVAPEITLPLNPNVDEARDDLIQDLAYSQALIKIGYVKGAGCQQPKGIGSPTQDIHYETDGLRAVMLFGDRPVSLASIKFFDWERLADYRQ